MKIATKLLSAATKWANIVIFTQRVVGLKVRSELTFKENMSVTIYYLKSFILLYRP